MTPSEFDKFKSDFKKSSKVIGPIFLIVVLISFVQSSYYTVDPDEEAIIIRFGKYVGTYPPGLHFKLPMGVDDVIHVKTKRVLQAEFGFRTRDSSSRRTT